MKNKLNNQRGFTLAELLIVVAIIAVLVAISIPIFTSKLEASREATDAANLRSAYAVAMNALILGKDDDGTDIDAGGDYFYTKSGKLSKVSGVSAMKGKSTMNGWQGETLTEELPDGVYFAYGTTADTAKTNFEKTDTVMAGCSRENPYTASAIRVSIARDAANGDTVKVYFGPIPTASNVTPTTPAG